MPLIRFRSYKKEKEIQKNNEEMLNKELSLIYEKLTSEKVDLPNPNDKNFYNDPAAVENFANTTKEYYQYKIAQLKAKLEVEKNEDEFYKDIAEIKRLKKAIYNYEKVIDNTNLMQFRLYLNRRHKDKINLYENIDDIPKEDIPIKYKIPEETAKIKPILTEEQMDKFKELKDKIKIKNEKEQEIENILAEQGDEADKGKLNDLEDKVDINTFTKKEVELYQAYSRKHGASSVAEYLDTLESLDKEGKLLEFEEGILNVFRDKYESNEVDKNKLKNELEDEMYTLAADEDDMRILRMNRSKDGYKFYSGVNFAKTMTNGAAFILKYAVPDEVKAGYDAYKAVDDFSLYSNARTAVKGVSRFTRLARTTPKQELAQSKDSKTSPNKINSSEDPDTFPHEKMYFEMANPNKKIRKYGEWVKRGAMLIGAPLAIAGTIVGAAAAATVVGPALTIAAWGFYGIKSIASLVTDVADVYKTQGDCTYFPVIM